MSIAQLVHMQNILDFCLNILENKRIMGKEMRWLFVGGKEN